MQMTRSDQLEVGLEVTMGSLLIMLAEWHAGNEYWLSLGFRYFNRIWQEDFGRG